MIRNASKNCERLTAFYKSASQIYIGPNFNNESVSHKKYFSKHIFCPVWYDKYLDILKFNILGQKGQCCSEQT